MKNILKNAAIAAILLTSISATAQLVIPAAITESSITSGGILSTAPSYGPTMCTNSATIDYSPFCSGMLCGMIPNPQLTAVVVDGDPGFSTNPPTLYLNDQTMPGWLPVAIPAPQGCYPDVIVANEASGSGDYLVGVIVNAGGMIRLFTYRIPGGSVGMGGLVVIPMGGITLGTATSNTLPHIDVIGEYSTPLMGLAMANKFAATWESAGTVMGCFGWMGLPTTALAPTVIGSGTSPDVAAVERFNGMTGGFEDWALFSYVDVTSTPNVLYYQEWCMSPVLPPSPAIVYDNTKTYYPAGSALFTSAIPRIDAIDNFGNNMPGTGKTTFCIATPVANSLTVEVVEYNDATGPLSGTDITSGLTSIALYKKVIPTVVFGPAANYTVGFYAYDGTTIHETYNSIAIDQGTGLPTGTGDAYTMNRITYAGSVHGMSHAASCNNDMPGQQQLLASWINNDDLWYKYSATAAPYAYKQESAATAVGAKEWSVSPNPASDYLVLSAPTTFTIDDEATYRLMDMTGKIVINHSIGGANEQIDVNKLPSGMYMITIHSKKESNKTIKFVKE